MVSWEVYLSQILFFLALIAVLQIRSIHLLLVPRSTKKRRASRMAYLQFHSLGVYNTRDRAGVMIFVSLAERHIEILADSGLSKFVTQDIWAAIVNEMAASMRADDLITGYENAIKRCSEILSQHFPDGVNPENELADGLIEI